MVKKPFIPEGLPPNVSLVSLVPKIAAAHAIIARFDESLSHLPNPRIVQRAVGTKEAVLSSRIEGTQVTLDEVFFFDADEDVEEKTQKQMDYREVINYRRALAEGAKFLDERPLTENVVKELHAILLDSVRGNNRAPGEFRKQQVYIGRPGVGIEEASFIPAPPQEISRLFSDLEKFIHGDRTFDEVVKAAIMHVQFESIHPFLDGNGRIGRLLVPLMMYQNGLTKYPNIFISEYLEEHRKEYYARLNAVSERDEWIEWVDFFLGAVIEQTKRTHGRVERIEALYSDLQKRASGFNSIYAHAFIDAIFQLPRFRMNTVKKMVSAKTPQSMYDLLEKFLRADIVQDLTPHQTRNKVYGFRALLDIIK
jgi:Fic family protein